VLFEQFHGEFFCATQGANLRFVVTNLIGNAQKIYDQIYCPRGEMENRIKEQQLGLFSDSDQLSLLVAQPIPGATLQLRLRFVRGIAPAWAQIHGIGSCSSWHHPAQVA